MKKLYSEKQYREYVGLMDKMANIDDIVAGFQIHLEIEDWLTSNHISEMTMEQMNTRLEKEELDELNGVKKEGKIIEFPKQ